MTIVYVLLAFGAVMAPICIGAIMHRRGVRSARSRDAAQYERTLAAVGIGASDGGSLGDLGTAYAVEDDERANPRPPSYYEERSSMFAPWRSKEG